MKIDTDEIDKLSDSEQLSIIFQDGLIYYIISIILLLIGIILTINDYALLSIILFILAILSMILGVKNIFLSKEQRINYLKSKLLFNTIKEAKKAGVTFTKEDIDNFRFEYDVRYHNKKVFNLRKKQEYEYQNNLMTAENKVKKLEQRKIEEIKKINNERWISIYNEKLSYNLIEGKVCINQNIYLFSDIKGAEINKKESYNVVTINTGKTKKHASLGGVIGGSLIFGPVGGAIGGSTLGKTTIKENSISSSIPICTHIGVVVDINGFKSEIELLNETINQSSDTYQNVLQQAENIISKLHFLSKQPVPTEYTNIEEEKSIIEIEKAIKKAKNELEELKEKTIKLAL